MNANTDPDPIELLAALYGDEAAEGREYELAEQAFQRDFYEGRDE